MFRLVLILDIKIQMYYLKAIIKNNIENLTQFLQFFLKRPGNSVTN
jgi:hypothetical protein